MLLNFQWNYGHFVPSADAQTLGFFLVGQVFVYGRKYTHIAEQSVELGKNQVCRPKWKDELDYF